jgi:hypothetical protein
VHHFHIKGSEAPRFAGFGCGFTEEIIEEMDNMSVQSSMGQPYVNQPQLEHCLIQARR